ncbi:MAG: Gingipain R, partial [Candidatus Cloacimonetes bacterium]|nr:Gingipain R [Candidatus Cloacimonadota bacterium]
MSETITLREKTFSPYFESVYSKSIFNYSPLESRDMLTRYPVKYIIISDPMFEAQLQPFIEWKIEKGFEIIEAYTNDPGVGSTTASIKNFIQTIYDAATPEDPAPSFILFVGDVSQIPAWSGSTGGHVTDLNYARLEGTDYVPEMYYGRFSANNTTELQPQIDKTLEYEKFEMPDPSYLGEVVMIAGMDATHGSTWGNGQINYGTTYYFNEAHGILSHTYLYPHSGSCSAQIIQHVSDGVAYINYTAHGSSTSWANPSFTISDINGLQNEHEYCLAVGNCCSTNSFEVTTCFGEAWLRADNKGAIGYIGGTNSTYWDEDYWWGVGAGNIVTNPTYEDTGLGVYDGLFHDHGEEFSDWTTTTGGMIYRGNLAVTEGGGAVDYYWEIYSVMGDPSLEVYLGIPAVNTATYPSVIFLGLETIQITAEPYSYVALTMDGEIYGTALINDTGIVNLEFEAFTNPGIAKLVITRQNHEPVIEEIEVIPSGGPYVIVNSYEVHD